MADTQCLSTRGAHAVTPSQVPTFNPSSAVRASSAFGSPGSFDAAWCTYGRSWTIVKATYKLTVTQDEKSMLTKMLDTCASSAQ
ncbi:hypothetical protein [Streptomyces sp. NPDC020597]|uniref:hypothetical protein n=1 Tax=unclassified Streptomyces TaxID=2593676 RepID=UPI00379E1A0C